MEELRTEKCMMENCEQRLWEVKFKEEKESPESGFGFFYFMPRQTKVLVRNEFKLYTIVNVFADIGGYLGLLLGESILSFILIGSNWMQKIVKTCKETIGKLHDQEKTEFMPTKAMPTSQSF